MDCVSYCLALGAGSSVTLSSRKQGVSRHAFLDPPHQGPPRPSGPRRSRRPARRAHQPPGLLRTRRDDLSRARAQRGRARRRHAVSAPRRGYRPRRALRHDRSARHAGGDAVERRCQRCRQPAHRGDAVRLSQHRRRSAVLRAPGHRPVRHRVRAARLRTGRLRADPQGHHVQRRCPMPATATCWWWSPLPRCH